MPNKFQKSVLERQKTEAERQGKPLDTPPPPEDEAPQAPLQPETKAAAEPVAPAAMLDVAAILRPQVSRSAKNKTFYLDSELVEAIKSVAAAQKVTESRLVNDILRAVLGLS